MLGGHSTPNTVVLGEGMSKYQVPPTSATIAAAVSTFFFKKRGQKTAQMYIDAPQFKIGAQRATLVLRDISKLPRYYTTFFSHIIPEVSIR